MFKYYFFLRILTVGTGFAWIENIEFNIELGQKCTLWGLMTLVNGWVVPLTDGVP